MIYVAGFMFDHAYRQVLLIKKLKPSWQKNRYNGIGGKVEPQELPISAMVREFSEETGVNTQPFDWVSFCDYEFSEGLVHFYYTVDKYNKYFSFATSTTEEEISRHYITEILNIDTIYNLNWLIPLALDPSFDFPGTGPIKVRE